MAPRRPKSLSRRHAALAALLLGLARLTTTFTSAAAPPRRLRVARSAASGFRSWKEAHNEAKSYEASLLAVKAAASRAQEKVDSLFLEVKNISKEYYAVTNMPAQVPNENQTGTPLTPFFYTPERELTYPDVNVTPPILAGNMTTSAALAGRFSSALKMPERLFPAQFKVGAADDPDAGERENSLWKETLDIVVETLDETFDSAERGVAAVRVAEEKAQRRRGPLVEGFRNRVIQQMIYATDGIFLPDQLDEWLTILQTDERLLKNLALLERSALQAEELQAVIRARQEQTKETEKGSELRERVGESLRSAYDKTRLLDIRIRSCIDAAKELPETLDAVKELNEAWESINPFKAFR